MTTTVSISERVEQLKAYIGAGKILEAMDEFYADDVEMQENSEAPTKGLAANIEREKQFLSIVKEWNWTKWHATAVNDGVNVSFIEYSFEFVNTDGETVVYDQAAVQRWRDGKIVSERFYHG
jgi:ketosteroid isomerase-like protein